MYCRCKAVYSQISATVDENGDTLNSCGNVCARWKYHFFNGLFVPSIFQEEVVDFMMQLSVRDYLDDA